MLERMTFSFLFRTAQFVLWAFLILLILAPTSNLYAQDPDDVDDVEEFFGDDDEYEDDEEYDDEYLDDDEYEDDEYEDEYEDDDEYEDEELSDDAENLGYTIDLAGSSPRFVNMNLIDWSSNIDLKASVEFPVLMQILGMRFRFGVEVGTFKFENKIPSQVNPPDDTYSGITGMGIISFPAGPGKIKFGGGIVGKSPGFMMEASYGIKIGGTLDVRGGIRATEVLNGETSKNTVLGHTGWMDGVLLLGINL
jgi:hypothetical protein